MTLTDVYLILMGVTVLVNVADLIIRRRSFLTISQEERKKEMEEMIGSFLLNKGNDKVKMLIHQYVESDEFKTQLIRTLNESDMSKKIDKLVLILCTNMRELKNSEMCR